MRLTTNYGLKKPEGSDVVNIDDFNYNADVIDSAIQEVKGKVDGLELTAQRVSIADSTNKFEATNVEDALLENKTSILSHSTKIEKLEEEVNGARLDLINTENSIINKLV